MAHAAFLAGVARHAANGDAPAWFRTLDSVMTGESRALTANRIANGHAPLVVYVRDGAPCAACRGPWVYSEKSRMSLRDEGVAVLTHDGAASNQPVPIRIVMFSRSPNGYREFISDHLVDPCEACGLIAVRMGELLANMPLVRDETIALKNARKRGPLNPLHQPPPVAVAVAVAVPPVPVPAAAAQLDDAMLELLLPVIAARAPVVVVINDEPEPVALAVPEPVARAVFEPDPEPVARAVFEPDPEPVARAVFEPDPEPVARLAFDPEPIALAMPEPEPEPEPVARAVFEPEPEPVARAAFDPEPDPVAVAAPDPELEPVARAAPEPVGEDAMDIDAEPAQVVPMVRLHAVPSRTFADTQAQRFLQAAGGDAQRLVTRPLEHFPAEEPRALVEHTVQLEKILAATTSDRMAEQLAAKSPAELEALMNVLFESTKPDKFPILGSEGSLYRFLTDYLHLRLPLDGTSIIKRDSVDGRDLGCTHFQVAVGETDAPVGVATDVFQHHFIALYNADPNRVVHIRARPLSRFAREFIRPPTVHWQGPPGALSISADRLSFCLESRQLVVLCASQMTLLTLPATPTLKMCAYSRTYAPHLAAITGAEEQRALLLVEPYAVAVRVNETLRRQAAAFNEGVRYVSVTSETMHYDRGPQVGGVTAGGHHIETNFEYARILFTEGYLTYAVDPVAWTISWTRRPVPLAAGAPLEKPADYSCGLFASVNLHTEKLTPLLVINATVAVISLRNAAECRRDPEHAVPLLEVIPLTNLSSNEQCFVDKYMLKATAIRVCKTMLSNDAGALERANKEMADCVEQHFGKPLTCFSLTKHFGLPKPARFSALSDKRLGPSVCALVKPMHTYTQQQTESYMFKRPRSPAAVDDDDAAPPAAKRARVDSVHRQ